MELFYLFFILQKMLSLVTLTLTEKLIIFPFQVLFGFSFFKKFNSISFTEVQHTYILYFINWVNSKENKK